MRTGRVVWCNAFRRLARGTKLIGRHGFEVGSVRKFEGGRLDVTFSFDGSLVSSRVTGMYVRRWAVGGFDGHRLDEDDWRAGQHLLG